MNKKQLIQSAESVYSYSAEAAEEFSSKKEFLVNLTNERMLARPEIIMLIGEENIPMMKDNHANQARFIESMLKEFDPVALTETVLWVFRSYRSRGFHTNYWAAKLNTWITVLKETLSETSYHAIAPIYEWIQTNIPVFTSLSDDDLNNFNPQY